MKTNDIKKGQRFLLRNGWFATMLDNKKGNIRLAEVEGFYTEMGSVYAHDIVEAQWPVDDTDRSGTWEGVELTGSQVKCAQMNAALW